MKIYTKAVKELGWSLRDIDDTYLDTLMEFLFFKESDPNIKVIAGKEYHRTTKVPNWL